MNVSVLFFLSCGYVTHCVPALGAEGEAGEAASCPGRPVQSQRGETQGAAAAPGGGGEREEEEERGRGGGRPVSEQEHHIYISLWVTRLRADGRMFSASVWFPRSVIEYL